MRTTSYLAAHSAYLPQWLGHGLAGLIVAAGIALIVVTIKSL